MGKDKRMDVFAKETFKLGTLRGFRHFKVEVRGREELLVTVWPGNGERSPSNQLRPMNERALHPASPCYRENGTARQWETDTEAVFLVGGYAHYNCPYVWVRKGHRFLGPSFGNADTHDAPIQLLSTQGWRTRTVHAWEIVSELIAATTSPPPTNPFALEHGLLETLPRTEALLLSGALASFLRDVFLSAAPYAAHVEGDLMETLRFHYSLLPDAAEANGR